MDAVEPGELMGDTDDDRLFLQAGEVRSKKPAP